MPTSGGILPFRRAAHLEVMIAHPGGPFWARKQEGAWTIVKGELEVGEDPLTGACREFREETGWSVERPLEALDLGEVRQRSGKRVLCWAVETDFDPSDLDPGMVEISIRGRHMTVPEIDQVRWCDPAEAATLLNPAQAVFVERLVTTLSTRG